ncbi:MAG: 4Fe-4S binding protein [Clostridiaceae bacterium]|nr:4Fe-4S binding protein [Clostridiaceae bacterium]
MKKKKSRVRTIVQILFFLLIALVVTNKILADSGHGLPFLSEASIHAVCPFGGVVSIYQFVTEGSYVHRIHDSSFVLMFLVLILTLLFGSVFCGWVCPLGSIQEWISKIGKKLFGKKYNHFMPKKIDKVLRYLRYGVLIWVLYVTAGTAQLVFRAVDPYYALFHFWTGEVAISALIILTLVVLASLWIERPWCKYLCPFGAVLGLISKISLFSLKRAPGTCIGCKNCDRVCPMNIEISSRNSVRHTNCIVCLQCSSEEACPVKDTLLLSTKLKAENQAGEELKAEKQVSEELKAVD